MQMFWKFKNVSTTQLNVTSNDVLTEQLYNSDSNDDWIDAVSIFLIDLINIELISVA